MMNATSGLSDFAPHASASLANAIAATRGALDRAVAFRDLPGPALADAATTLGRVTRGAGLPFDALLAAVTEAVERADGPSSPEQDAVLLYLWRLAGHAYQTTPAPRPTEIDARSDLATTRTQDGSRAR